MNMSQRNDNIMRNMAREVQLLEYDNKMEAKKPVSEHKRKIGVIAFWVLLFAVVAVFVIGFAGLL